ncbi:hypothetical protein F5887DRAFT_915764 [Amanita rubescens]|nr:hypothetical protein F5887DRAFT_915764 [Amanita rubescens]
MASTLAKTLSFINANVVNGLTYCEVDDHNLIDGFWTFWLPFVVFQGLVFAFTVRKVLEYYHLDIRLTDLHNFNPTMGFNNLYISGKNYDAMSGLGFALPLVMGGRMMRNTDKGKHEKGTNEGIEVVVHMKK